MRSNQAIQSRIPEAVEKRKHPARAAVPCRIGSGVAAVDEIVPAVRLADQDRITGVFGATGVDEENRQGRDYGCRGTEAGTTASRTRLLHKSLDESPGVLCE
jgi:hypothetical protein